MSLEARQRKTLAAVAVCLSAGVLAFLAFGGIGENLVYYWNPTELLAAGKKAQGATIRLGGLVAPGSIRYGEGLELSFEVTDGEKTVPVHARAVPPAMFREKIGVVVEGTVRPDGVFETQRLMVKHDNQYQAPGSEDTRDLKELMKTMASEEVAR